MAKYRSSISDPTAAARMRRYRAAKRKAGLRLSRTWVDTTPQPPPPYSDHSLLEARSLALHCLIAQRLHAQPDLVAKARANLQRWKKRSGVRQPRYLVEWDRLLSKRLPDLLAFITSTSPEAVRMRQSTPFAGILSPQVRKRVYDAFRT